MAKRKKKESIADFRKRVSNTEICDTSPPPLALDITAKDEDVNANGIIETRLKNYRKDTIVFSMRMEQDLLDHIKQVAREKSAELKADVPYQLLMIQAIEEKYPIGE